MTIESIGIHDDVFAHQMGEDGVFTEPAYFDPSGENIEIYGIFDKNDFRDNRGAGNVRQRKDGPRFIVHAVGVVFDVYENKILSVRGIEHIISEIDSDKNGAQVIWLK